MGLIKLVRLKRTLKFIHTLIKPEDAWFRLESYAIENYNNATMLTQFVLCHPLLLLLTLPLILRDLLLLALSLQHLFQPPEAGLSRAKVITELSVGKAMQPAITTKSVVGCARASTLGDELCRVEVTDVILVGGDENVGKVPRRAVMKRVMVWMGGILTWVG